MIPLFIIKQGFDLEFIYSDHILRRSNLSVIEYFHQQCLSYGSTLKGNMDAIRHHLKIRQKVPICLSVSARIMYFPIPLNNQEMWVLYDHDYQIKKSEHNTILTIHQLSFKLPVDRRVILRQTQRCERYLNSFKAHTYLKISDHIFESCVSHYLV